MHSKLVDFACEIWNTATAIHDVKAEDHSDMGGGREKVKRGAKQGKWEDSTTPEGTPPPAGAQKHKRQP